MTSLNERAARAVAVHARDVSDARFLLDMLGLVDGPDGREILPDDTRALPVATLGSPGSGADEPPARRATGEPPARGVTTPPGLRVLPPPATTPPKTPKPPTARPPVARPAKGAAAAIEGQLSTRPTEKTSRRKVAACGTPSGYARHYRLKEPACTACKAAIAAVSRARAAKRRGDRPPAPRAQLAECGTRSGYERHRRLGEEPCQGCREANAARTRDRTQAAEAVEVASPMAPAGEPPAGPGPGQHAEDCLTRIDGPCTCPGVMEALQADLDELERTDPAVAAAARSYDDMVTRVTASAPHRHPATALAAVVDAWLAGAQRSPDPAVRRAAGTATAALLHLRTTTDELARAERAATTRGAS